MTPIPSRLTEDVDRVVIDASVALNLLGTGAMPQLLRLLPCACMMERRAFGELLTIPGTRQPAAPLLAQLCAEGLLIVTDLSKSLIPEFVDIALNWAPNGLDDGEAATIALANSLPAAMAIDERRARNAVTQRLPDARLLDTMDLLTASTVTAHLGMTGLADLIYAACTQARMRVDDRHLAWVVALLGPRTARCTSIPRNHRNQGAK